ncbi:MAG TPA: carboxypeptidase-like regulatory domain-containing protein [Bryobacteraceae bacterium]|nr:carboxypeptidase-like regulatory domain-containing protein [Bryobacteraceae bacterium]
MNYIGPRFMNSRLVQICLAVMAIAMTQNELPGSDTGSTVTGRVVDAESGTPIAGVRVVSGRIEAITGSDGSYRLVGLPAGRVKLAVPTNYLYPKDPLGSRVVNLASDETKTDIELRIRRPGSLTGRLLDENAEPLPGIRVSLIGLREEIGSEPPFDNESLKYVVWKSAVTDEKGAYRFESVLAGLTYWLQATPDIEYPTAQAGIEPARRPGTLHLTYYPDAPNIGSALPVILHSGEQRGGADLHLRRSPSFCAEITLVGPSGPAAMDFAVQDGEQVIRRNTQTGHPRPTGRSGPNGRMNVCELYEGTFEITAWQASGSADLPVYIGTLPVTIRDQDVVGLRLIATPPLLVRGEVEWETPPPEEHRLSVVIGPRPKSAPTVVRSSVPGQFTFRALPGVRYSVRVLSGISNPIYVRDITYGNESVQFGAFMPDGQNTLHIVLGDDSGAISGTVKDRDGKPRADAWVSVIPDSISNLAQALRAIVSEPCDDNGVFSMKGFAPGKYHLVVTPARISTTGTVPNILQMRQDGTAVDLNPHGNAFVTLEMDQ